MILQYRPLGQRAASGGYQCQYVAAHHGVENAVALLAGDVHTDYAAAQLQFSPQQPGLWTLFREVLQKRHGNLLQRPVPSAAELPKGRQYRRIKGRHTGGRIAGQAAHQRLSDGAKAAFSAGLQLHILHEHRAASRLEGIGGQVIIPHRHAAGGDNHITGLRRLRKCRGNLLYGISGAAEKLGDTAGILQHALEGIAVGVDDLSAGECLAHAAELTAGGNNARQRTAIDLGLRQILRGQGSHQRAVDDHSLLRHHVSRGQILAPEHNVAAAAIGFVQGNAGFRKLRVLKFADAVGSQGNGRTGENFRRSSAHHALFSHAARRNLL